MVLERKLSWLANSLLGQTFKIPPSCLKLFRKFKKYVIAINYVLQILRFYYFIIHVHNVVLILFHSNKGMTFTSQQLNHPRKICCFVFLLCFELGFL